MTYVTSLSFISNKHVRRLVNCESVECMVANRLVWYLEKHSIMRNLQTGFWKNRCTLDQVIRLQDTATQSLRNHSHTLAIFLEVCSRSLDFLAQSIAENFGWAQNQVIVSCRWANKWSRIFRLVSNTAKSEVLAQSGLSLLFQSKVRTEPQLRPNLHA